MNIRSYKYLLPTLLFFGIIYSLVSLVNHYNFRTYALDLGAYTNALYDYTHLQWNDSAVFKDVKENLLADHFDLYLVLFSPLSFIFGSYTLLLVQLFFILAGGVGVYRYFLPAGKTAAPALYATLYFYLFFGIFSAISFDYHSNVVAASLVPWLFCFIKRRKIGAAAWMLLLILVSKENMSLWLSFICLGLIAEYWKDRQIRNFLLFSCLLCVCYFFTITTIVMPGLSNNNMYPHFNYSFLGSNAFEALGSIVLHPWECLKVLFVNHTSHPFGDYVKTEFHLLLIFSGLPLLILKPHYFLMLIPVYFQKLFNDSHVMWGIYGQYSVEFAPILAIGIFSAIRDFRSEKVKTYASIVVIASALVCTVRTMDHTVLFTNKSSIRIYKLSHYTRDYPVAKVHEALSEIPENAIVSAQSPFLPHLSLRDNIYQFPTIKDAEYIVYSRYEETYPMDQGAFDLLSDSLEHAACWTVKFKGAGLTILQKSCREEKKRTNVR